MALSVSPQQHINQSDQNMNIILFGTAMYHIHVETLYVITVLSSLVFQKHVHFTATAFSPNCYL